MIHSKYKLITKYPGRTIGDIAIYDPEILDSNFVWEKDNEIVPKDFQPDVTPSWFTKVHIKNYKIEVSLDKILEVSRFFDGLSFKIGDETNNGTIREFKENNDHMRVYFTNKPENYHVSINTLKIVEKPLFLTDDNVEIFEGDTFYFLAQNYPENKTGIYGKLIATTVVTASWAHKRFASEKAVEDYILQLQMDEKVFSLNDIAKVYSTANHRSRNHNTGYDGWSKQAFQLRQMLTKHLEEKA